VSNRETKTVNALSICTLVLLMAPSPAHGQPSVTWLWQSENELEDGVNAISADGLGGAVLAGGVRYDSVGGLLDGQLFTLDAAGNPNWTREVRTTNFDYSSAVAMDGQGGVFVAGATWGDLAATNAGFSDAYVAKYDAAGSRLWLVQLGSTGNDWFRGAAADRFGNVILSGHTNRNFAGTHAGSDDGILSKFDADGNHLWSRQFGGQGSDVSEDVSVDKVGAIYVAGTTATPLGSPGQYVYDGFLRKYDGDGMQLWIRQIGSTADDIQADAVATDELGNVFVTGWIERFDASLGASTGRAFLSKYDAEGDHRWTREFEHARESWSRDVSADGLGNAIIAGHFGDTQFAFGNSDGFVSKYDAEGNLAWTLELGTDETDSINGVSTDLLGNIFVAGETAGSLGRPSTGGYDSWVALLRYRRVPEPSGMALIAIATIAAFAFRRHW
jgi:hypothetical protein